MNSKKLKVELITIAIAICATGCSIDLTNSGMTPDELFQSMAEEQLEKEAQKYKAPKDDAAYVSYNVTEGLVERYKKVYDSGDTSDLNKAELELYRGLKEALDEASRYTEVIDKEKAVHDWIVLNCEYDYENLEADNLPDQVFTADGVYRYHKAVCDGYQKAFLLAMRILDIPCESVTGTGEQDGESENHAWNAVQIDGNWYQVDVTWDDPVPDEKGRVLYTYFNVTDAIMRRNHSYAFEYVCNSTAFSYMDYYVGQRAAKTKAELDQVMREAFTEGASAIEVYVAEDIFKEVANSYYDYSKNYADYGVAASASCSQYTKGETMSDGTPCYLVPFDIAYSKLPVVDSQSSFNQVVQKASDDGLKESSMIIAQGHSVEEFWEYRESDWQVVKYVGDGYGIFKIEFTKR